MGTYGRLGAHRRDRDPRRHRRGARSRPLRRSRDGSARAGEDRRSSRRSPIRLDAAPAPKSYFREELFQRGDTLPAFLERLGIEDAARRQAGEAARAAAAASRARTSRAEVSAEGEPIVAELPQRARHADARSCAEANGSSASPTTALQLDDAVAMKSGVIRSSLFAATDDAEHSRQRRHAARATSSAATSISTATCARATASRWSTSCITSAAVRCAPGACSPPSSPTTARPSARCTSATATTRPTARTCARRSCARRSSSRA